MVLNTQNECLSQGYIVNVYYKMTIFILKINVLTMTMVALFLSKITKNDGSGYYKGIK